MGNPAFKQMRAIIRATNKALGQERTVEYNYTNSALAAALGNLSTTTRGIGRALTAQNAKQFAAIRNLAQRQATKNTATIRAGENAYAGLGGGAVLASSAPSRGAAKAGRIASKGSNAAAVQVGAAGQAALAIGRQTVGAERAAGKFELNQALAARTVQDTATVAQMRFQLQEDILQNRLARQQEKLQARLQRKNIVLQSQLDEANAEKQAQLNADIAHDQARYEERLNEKLSAYQDSLTDTGGTGGKNLDTAISTIQSAVANQNASRDQVNSIAGSLIQQYNLGPQAQQQLKSYINSLGWDGDGGNAHSQSFIPPVDPHTGQPLQTELDSSDIHSILSLARAAQNKGQTMESVISAAQNSAVASAHALGTYVTPMLLNSIDAFVRRYWLTNPTPSANSSAPGMTQQQVQDIARQGSMNPNPFNPPNPFQPPAVDWGNDPSQMGP